MKRLNLSVFLLLVCIIMSGSISAQDDTAPTVVNDILLGDTQIRPNFRVKQILIHRNHRWAMEYDSDLKRLESIPNIKEKKDEIRKLLEAQSQEFRSLSDEYKEVVLQQALLGNSGSYPDCYVYLSNRPNDKSENKDYYIDLVQCVIYSTNKKIERNEMQKGSLGGYDAYQYKFPFPVYVKGFSDEIIKNAKDHRASMVTAVVDLDLEDFLKSYIPNPDTLTVKGFRKILFEIDNFMRIVDNGNNNVLTKSGAKYQNTAYYKKLINKLADTGDAWALEMAGRADELVDRYEKAAKAGDMDAALQVYYKKGIEEGYPLIKELLQRDWSSLKWSRKIGYTEYQGYPALINSLSVDLQKKNPELDFDLNKTMWEEKKLYRCGLETGSAYEEGKGTTKNPQ